MTARRSTEPKKLSADYRRLLSEDWGRRILHDLYGRCYMARSTVPRGGDTGALIFNEGRRSVFLYIQQTMGLDFKDFEVILEEE